MHFKELGDARVKDKQKLQHQLQEYKYLNHFMDEV